MLLELLNGFKPFIMPFGGIWGHLGAFGGIWGPPQAFTRMRDCAKRSNTATLKMGHSSRLLPTFGGLWGSPKCCWSL